MSENPENPGDSAQVLCQDQWFIWEIRVKEFDSPLPRRVATAFGLLDRECNRRHLASIQPTQPPLRQGATQSSPYTGMPSVSVKGRSWRSNIGCRISIGIEPGGTPELARHDDQ